MLAPAPYSAVITTQTSNNYQENMDDDGKFGLVRVSPAVPQSNVLFLEMLWPSSPAEWVTRPDVQPLDAALPHRGFSMAVGSSQES